MSAILKALKKLEQESKTSDNTLLSDPSGGPARRRIKMGLFPGLIVLAIVVAAGLLFFAQKQPATAPEKMAYTTPKPVAAEKPSPIEKPEESKKPVETAKEAVSRMMASNTTPPEKDLPVLAPEQEPPQPEYAYSTMAQESTDKEETGENKVETYPLSDVYTHDTPGFTEGAVHDENPFAPIPPTEVPETEPDHSGFGTLKPTPPAPLEKKTVPPPVLPAPETRPTQTVLPKPVPSQATSNLETIQDPSVKLQAISWSTDPDKRMAIINGRICREKDRVGDYVIVAIHAEDVVVSKGSVTGKIVFKIR